MYEVGKVYATAEGNHVKLLEQNGDSFTGSWVKVGEHQSSIRGKFSNWNADGAWAKHPGGVHDLKDEVPQGESDAD